MCVQMPVCAHMCAWVCVVLHAASTSWSSFVRMPIRSPSSGFPFSSVQCIRPTCLIAITRRERSRPSRACPGMQAWEQGQVQTVDVLAILH